MNSPLKSERLGKEEVPRANTQSIVNAEDSFALESEVRGYCRDFTATFNKAEGSIITDVEGNDYIDFLAGASSLNYGHNDPHMAKALVNYVLSGNIANSLDLHTTSKVEFIDAFNRLILKPRNFSYRLQFTGPAGNNAVEAALKLAKKITGRSEVISFTNGFHGMTLGALAATGNQHHRMGASVQLPGVTRAFFEGYFGDAVDTADMLDQLLSDPSSGVDAPAAFIIEPIQGEGGLNVASKEWMQKIANIAKRHGALLIIDDIQAGIGRSGDYFSFEPLGIEPDMVLLSKSLSGFGLPMAIVLIKPEYDQWLPGEHNGTFRGNNLAFVTAKVALEKFWSDDLFMGDVARRSAIVHKALTEISTMLPGARVKGRGLMLGLDVGTGALCASIAKTCFKRGLLIESCGANGEVLKVLAPLTTSDDVLTQGLDIIKQSIEDLLYSQSHERLKHA